MSETEEYTGYTTPPGVDEREVPYPSSYSAEQVDELKQRGIKFINWNGVCMATGSGMSMLFYDEVASKKRERRSVIVAMVGAPGEGKTWSGIRLCEIFDPAFDPVKQIVFNREHLLDIISKKIKIEPGQCILIDEAHMATGARHWFEEIQRELVDQIATVRSMGIILIFVVLHISMLDKIIRMFVLTYQLHMEHRGVVVEYKVTMPRFESKVYHPREGKIALTVPSIDECPSNECLWCKEYKDWCLNIRAVYERLKDKYLREASEKTKRKAEAKQLKDNPLTQTEQLELIYKNKDFVAYTKRGLIDGSSIQDIFTKEGRDIGMSTADTLAKRAPRKYPDLKPPEEEDTGI